MSKTHRIALGIEYIGTSFNGFQKQKGTRNTIQQNIESALSKVADYRVKTVCSGRTDAGVHALGQVIHFDSPVHRANDSWIKGTNSNLPPEIRVIWSKEVSEDFHARFSAKSRHYKYLIRNSNLPSAFYKDRSYWVNGKLKITKMRNASRYLIGEHDFNAFRNSGCQSKSSQRNMAQIKIEKDNGFISIDLEANAFLLNMVRIIVGTLIDVGQDNIEAIEVEKILQSKDRKLASKTAPASGLYFLGPKYSQEENIPQIKNFAKLI